MKPVFKILSAVALAAGMSNLVGCGDDSPNYIDFDESFEMVLAKASYSYHSKDSTLVVKQPECKASTLGYVVWEELGGERDTMKAYRSDDLASVRPLHVYTWDRYSYDGGDFPIGLWQDSKAVKQEIQNAKRFLKKGIVEDVFRYDGECFAKSLRRELFKKNTSIIDADSSLAKFYLMFQPESKRNFDSKAMLDDIAAPKCNKLTMYDDEVSISLGNFKNNSGTVTLAYGKNACSIKFKLRHAIEKADCEDAFADFEKDKSKNAFRFEDYSEEVNYDVYCIKRLVLDMQEEKNILPRKANSDDEVSSDELARATVKFVLEGMR